MTIKIYTFDESKDHEKPIYLALDRDGETIQLKVVDEEGYPVTGGNILDVQMVDKSGFGVVMSDKVTIKGFSTVAGCGRVQVFNKEGWQLIPGENPL